MIEPRVFLIRHRAACAINDKKNMELNSQALQKIGEMIVPIKKSVAVKAKLRLIFTTT